MAELIEQSSRLGLDDEQSAMFRLAEAVGDRAVDHGDERIEVTGDVEQPDRLLMQSELRSRQHLEQLFKRPESSRQREEAVRQLGHQRLAFVHVVRHTQVCHTGVQQLLRRQELRDDSNHLATCRQHRIGDRPHQPDTATTINEFDPLDGQQLSQLTCRATMHRVRAGTGTAEDTESMQVTHVDSFLKSLSRQLTIPAKAG